MLIVYVVLILSRISQVNRCISTVVGLGNALDTIRNSTSSTSTASSIAGAAQSLFLTSRAIGTMLSTTRNYMEKQESDNTPVFTYDPRMLVFEFAHCLVLRQTQVTQVRLFASSDAIVHQMVMGGKMIHLF